MVKEGKKKKKAKMGEIREGRKMNIKGVQVVRGQLATQMRGAFGAMASFVRANK